MEVLYSAPVYIFLFVALYSQVFLLITFIEGRKQIGLEDKGADNNPALKEYPTVTIIIPCWNEETTIHRTMRSLLELDYPKEKLAMFLIDDGSTDRTWEVIEEYKKYPNIKTFQKKNGGKYTALNFGLERTTSEFVGCLDADSFVEPETLKKIMRYFERDPEVMAVTPSIRIYEPETLIQMMQQTEYNLSIFMRKMLSFLDAIHVTPGPFSIFRKRVFDELGPYRHAHNTEDMEIAMRMHKNHYRIVNAHTAYVHTVGPRTIPKLYVQRLRWVTGFLKNAIDYRDMFFKKKYGNLGLFTLPAAVLSIASVLYIAGYSIFSLVSQLISFAEKIRTVGFSFDVAKILHFDWFFLNIHMMSFLAIIMFATTLTMIMAGKKMAEGKYTITREVFYYIFIYGFIVPFWLGRAVINTIFAKEASWR